MVSREVKGRFGKHFTEEEIEAVCKMRDMGFKLREISDKTDRSIVAVSACLKRYYTPKGVKIMRDVR